MKKQIVILVVIFTAYTQAMEQVNQWSITLYDTKINLIKGFIGDAGDRVSAIIVGRNQQQTLREPSLGDIQDVGQCYSGQSIYKKSKDDESASDDDTYKPYEHADYSSKDDTTKIWKRATEIKVAATIVAIIEPRIMKTNSFDSEYNTIEVPYYINRKSCWDGAEGTKAIEEAIKDLKMCYEKILDRLVKSGDKKSIALQALSTEIGFPREKAAPIAVKTIVEFIKNNSGAYAEIEMFVKKRSEFDLYKNLLEKSVSEK
ncbi:MAG TPA: hypothetical protein VHX42_00560 [Candidatus Babeliales bacterium]|nr:hypothetical protein [Candidatus Babeliales bacterium]